jgi:hypothetical protein
MAKVATFRAESEISHLMKTGHRGMEAQRVGDKGIRRRVDNGTRGIYAVGFISPCLLVSLSPCPLVPSLCLRGMIIDYGVRAMREPDPGGTQV